MDPNQVTPAVHVGDAVIEVGKPRKPLRKFTRADDDDGISVRAIPAGIPGTKRRK